MKFHRSLWLATVLGASAYACHHDGAPGANTPSAPTQMAPSTGDPGALPDPNTPAATPATPATPGAVPMAPGAPGPTGPLQPGTSAPSPNGTTAPTSTMPTTKPTTMGDAGSTRPPGSTGATNGDLGTPANRGGGAIGSTAQGMSTLEVAGPGDAITMAPDAGVGVTAPRDGGMPPGGNDAGAPGAPPKNPLPPTSPNGPGTGSANPGPTPGPGPGSGVTTPRPR